MNPIPVIASWMTVLAVTGAAVRVAGSQGGDQSPSPAVLALGDSVFHGKAGGALCYVCHGPDGKGVKGIGPSLADKEWVNGDGTVAFIEKVIVDGVPKPKKFPAPMPPGGGGKLTDAHVKAAAAYVHALSQPKN